MTAKVGSTGILVLLLFAGCSLKTPPAATPSVARQELIDELKEFQTVLGIDATRNFSSYSSKPGAIDRCYFTGKLELPSSYRELRLAATRGARCAVDERQYDVFLYPAEAVATGKSPVTPALEQAPLERVLVVVPHEDFHNQTEARKPPAEIAEAAATLVGFLAASDFAREKYGAESPAFQRLSGEARRFAEKAILINTYFDKLTSVYAAMRDGRLTRRDALERKQTLFSALQQECRAITPEPVTFNKCPAALNNAGLAFDRTYTRAYGLMFKLYLSEGENTKATIAAVKQLLESKERWER